MWVGVEESLGTLRRGSGFSGEIQSVSVEKSVLVPFGMSAGRTDGDADRVRGGAVWRWTDSREW